MEAVPAGRAEVGQGCVPLAATLESWWLDLVTFPCHLPLSLSLSSWEGKFAMVCPVKIYLWRLCIHPAEWSGTEQLLPSSGELRFEGDWGKCPTLC